jgi:hypothetical protein
MDTQSQNKSHRRRRLPPDTEQTGNHIENKIRSIEQRLNKREEKYSTIEELTRIIEEQTETIETNKQLIEYNDNYINQQLTSSGYNTVIIQQQQQNIQANNVEIARQEQLLANMRLYAEQLQSQINYHTTMLTSFNMMLENPSYFTKLVSLSLNQPEQSTQSTQ